MFGAIAYAGMNVDQFPEADFPIVTVTTIYPGAGPETMETQVAERIEEVVSGLAGVKAVRSTSLEGVVSSMQYLGHSLVYRVKIDWIDLEVRTNPVGVDERFRPGDEVAIWWDRTADWVVPDDA